MMSVRQKLRDELKALSVTFGFFTGVLGFLVLLKKLALAEYQIEFRGLAVALMGALVLSKVVLVLEHVSLGAWVRSRPAWVDVVLRTALYSLGVVAVLLLEKGFEGRHEHGGLLPALMSVFHDADSHHVWINTLVVSGALLIYNVLSVVRRHLGEWGILRLLRSPLPDEHEADGHTGDVPGARRREAAP